MLFHPKTLKQLILTLCKSLCSANNLEKTTSIGSAFYSRPSSLKSTKAGVQVGAHCTWQLRLNTVPGRIPGINIYVRKPANSGHFTKMFKWFCYAYTHKYKYKEGKSWKEEITLWWHRYFYICEWTKIKKTKYSEHSSKPKPWTNTTFVSLWRWLTGPSRDDNWGAVPHPRRPLWRQLLLLLQTGAQITSRNRFF